MLMKIVTDLKPDYIVACYDLPQKTFRHEAYEGYKAGRAKADDALVAQLKNSRQIFEAFNIPIYDAPGFEADDVLGTIVEKIKKNPPAGGVDIIIASGDMDTMQLVDGKKVQVYTLKKGINDTVLYDEGKVIERFGFKPKFLPDYKGFRGDPSDNIPGVTGIGSKTARELLGAYGSIEKIFAHIKELSPALERKLEGKKDQALMSKNLATIHRMATMPHIRLADLTLRPLDETILVPYFTHLGFHSLTRRLYTNSNTLL